MKANSYLALMFWIWWDAGDFLAEVIITDDAFILLDWYVLSLTVEELKDKVSHWLAVISFPCPMKDWIMCEIQMSYVGQRNHIIKGF